MPAFIGEHFLLGSETARALYHEHAAKLPIVDYHCHINPKEIYEDLHYNNITEVWLGGDHYKWRVIRANGYPERVITGDADPYEKFEAWAHTVPKLIGNPLYHWTHLELKRYFGIEETLSPRTCKEIWEQANKVLQTLSVRKILELSNVTAICTTDDPADDLCYHKLLQADRTLKTRVLPAFRPDKAVNIGKVTFRDYVKQLEAASGVPIHTIEDVKTALTQRLDYFAALGCVASDHGLDYIVCAEDREKANAIFAAALAGNAPTRQEAEIYKTELLLFLAQEYHKRGWVMQLHYGAARDNNPSMFQKLGPDTGYDAISGIPASGAALGKFFGMLEREHTLPKTIVYSLNPTDNAQIATVIGCFQSGELPGKLQHGSAWWFNDTRRGMIDQLTSVAELSVLPNFVGMLTDSRSFLSYTRHEYFRRILCDLLGAWVENGEYPRDMEALGAMVRNIGYYNAVRYFGFPV